MIGRWVIRSIFLLPLLPSVSGWAVSYAHPYSVGGWGSIGGALACRQIRIVRGDIHVFYDHSGGGDEIPDWEVDKRLWGFNVQAFHSKTLGLESLVMDIPFWFPTTLSAVAFFFVWRKTGQKTLGQGFPVVMKTNPATTTASKTGTIPHQLL